MPGIVVRVLDSRLGDRLFNREPSDLIVTPTMPMRDIVNAILGKLGGRSLGRLDILAHGYYTQHDARLRMSNVGGQGVMLGKENLGFDTVGAFAALKPRFDIDGRIDMFACQIADHVSADGPAKSGEALMRELARVAGVVVRASDSAHNFQRNAYLGTIDRGTWEGAVYLFYPDGRKVEELVSR